MSPTFAISTIRKKPITGVRRRSDGGLRRKQQQRLSSMTNQTELLSPQEMFERGAMTPERYYAWQTPRSRERQESRFQKAWRGRIR